MNIRVDVDAEQVWLEVRDNGRGITEDRLRAVEPGSGAGIGLAGMRERVRELGGGLKIESSKAGTLLKIFVPIVTMTTKSDETTSPSRGASA